MTGLAVAVQAAVKTALEGSTALAEACGGPPAVFDVPPPKETPFPYLVIGEDQVLPEPAEEYDGADVAITVHLWDRPEPPELGKARVKAMTAAARAALLDYATIPLDGHRLTDADPEGERHLDDPGDGGATKHSILSLIWLTEPL